LQIVTFGLGAALLGLSLWVIAARFRYPIDGEWMTGAVRDGVDRVRDGQPLYAAPSARFVPFVYTPIYFWLAGALSRVVSTFVACKLVSLAATLATGWGIHRISRTLGATKLWAAVGLLLFVATYPLTLFFYDIERVDALSAAFVVVAIALLVSRPSMRWSAFAGVLLGLAFFAKQPGLLAFGAAIAGLAFAGERRRALVVGGVGALVFAGVFAYLEITTHGWFRYYCVKLPQAHGMQSELLSTFFIIDVPKAFAIATGSVAIVAPVAWSFLRRRRVPQDTSWQHVVFAFVLAAGMAGAFSLRAHKGGWANVLVAWLPLGCAACAVAATRAEEAARATTAQRLVSLLLLGGVSLQLLGAMFDPNDNSPNADDLRERERFIVLARRLEVDGEVLITTGGHIAKPSSLHAAALFDIIRAGDHAPADLLEGLAQRRYSALFVGAPDEFRCGNKTCDELVEAIEHNYFVAGRRHERDRNGMSGFDARPRWLMRPRKAPLPPMSLKTLFLRQHIEMGLAEMESAKSPLDSEIVPADEIEALAAAQVESLAGASAPDLR
jgi:hypothetical protein